MSEAFFRLYQGLPREGPGEAADVLWAIGTAGTAGPARVLDAGCGSGADVATLARALPEATIEGVEKHQGFVDEAGLKLAEFAPRVAVRCGEMAMITGPYDLIWCAGAAYFLGVTEVLTKWRAALAPGGRVAFSEIVWLCDDPPPVLRDFWAEYAGMTGIGGLRARIEAAGYDILGERLLGPAAWDGYYAPIEARIAELRRGQVGPELAEVLDDQETEIALRRQYPEAYGYALSVVAPR